MSSPDPHEFELRAGRSVALRRLAFLLVVALTLWAGLHPFSFARSNHVQWCTPPGGLRFAPESMAVSVHEIEWDTADGPAAIAFQLWLEPQVPVADDRDIVVILDDARMPAVRVMQSGVDLVVASRVTNPDGERWYNDFRFLRVMEGTDARNVVVCPGEPHVRAFVDGGEVRAVGGYGIPLVRRGVPISGLLLIGSDPGGRTSWAGTLRGLVVHTSLPAWAQGAGAAAPPVTLADALAAEPSPRAAYAFSEGGGDTVRDLAGSDDPLHLPAYHHPVDATLLGTANRSPLENVPMLVDVAVNVLGFLPLGFVVAAFLRRRRWSWAATIIVTTIACGATSLGIEWLQVLMPTRHSSMLDLGLNTLGGALGATLGWRWSSGA